MANEFGIPPVVEEFIRASAQKSDITSGICTHCSCELEPNRVYAYRDGQCQTITRYISERHTITTQIPDIICEDCMLNAGYNKYRDENNCLCCGELAHPESGEGGNCEKCGGWFCKDCTKQNENGDWWCDSCYVGSKVRTMEEVEEAAMQ